MIIFNELKYAEKLLSSKELLTKIKQRDLNIIAKYFAWKGYTGSEIAQAILEYAKRNYADFNEIISSTSLRYALSAGMKYPLREQADVNISKGEIASIRQIENYRTQKILFTMLAISKYFYKSGEHLYYNGSIGDLFRLAKLTNLGRADRIGIIHELDRHKYIEANLRGGYKILIGETDEIEPEEIHTTIENMDNLISKFPTQCSVCGKEIYGKPRSKNICQECYIEKRKKDIRKNVAKFRKND
jgi:hypothetical protein